VLGRRHEHQVQSRKNALDFRQQIRGTPRRSARWYRCARPLWRKLTIIGSGSRRSPYTCTLTIVTCQAIQNDFDRCAGSGPWRDASASSRNTPYRAGLQCDYSVPLSTFEVGPVAARTLAPGVRYPLASSRFAEGFPGRGSPVDFRQTFASKSGRVFPQKHVKLRGGQSVTFWLHDRTLGYPAITPSPRSLTPRV